MKTLTVAEGRQKLGYWLKQAVAGQDIGIVIGSQVVALRPTPVHSGDYALREYGITPGEAARASRRIKAEVKLARKRGDVKRFTGKADDLD